MSSEKTEPEKDAKPKKRKGLMMKLLIGLGLIGAGGGGVFGILHTGLVGGSAGEHKKQDNHPRLIKKGEEDLMPPRPKAARKAKARRAMTSREKAAVATARPITASAMNSPRISRIRQRWSK
jgi:hypothetical protein